MWKVLSKFGERKIEKQKEKNLKNKNITIRRKINCNTKEQKKTHDNAIRDGFPRSNCKQSFLAHKILGSLYGYNFWNNSSYIWKIFFNKAVNCTEIALTKWCHSSTFIQLFEYVQEFYSSDKSLLNFSLQEGNIYYYLQGTKSKDNCVELRWKIFNKFSIFFSSVIFVET